MNGNDLTKREHHDDSRVSLARGSGPTHTHEVLAQAARNTSRPACLCVLLTAMMAICPLVRGEENTVILEAGGYASVEAARAVWKPIEGSPLIEVTDQGILRLPCNFDTNDNWRVAWDREGSWDLSAFRRITVEIAQNSDRRRSITGMILYLYSPSGWYGSIFEAVRKDHRIELFRNQFGSEGRPGGWHKIDRIRICVKTSRPIPQAVHLKSIRAVVGDPRVGVYQGAGEDPAISQRAQQMAHRLHRLEIDHRVLEEKSVEAGIPARLEVMILPMNPGLSANATEAVETFVGKGGKLIVCGPLPGPVARILGVEVLGRMEGASALPPVTRHAHGFHVGRTLTSRATIQAEELAEQVAVDRMVLDLIRRLSPGAMRELCERRETELGRAAGFAGRAALEKEIAKNLEALPGSKEAGEAFAAARRTFVDARKAAQAGDHAKGAELFERAEQEYLKSYALSVPGKPGEMRTLWVSDSRGPNERDWDSAMESMARGGYNAVMSFMLRAGGAAYWGKILPVVPLARERDLLAEAVAAGKKYGIAVYAAKANYWLWTKNSRFWPKDEAFAKTLRPDRFQVRLDGKRIDDHLCPSHPENRKLELETMLEVVRDYDVAGIVMDYIRYPDDKHCYCDGCRSRFEAQVNVKVADWPADVYTGAHKEEYRQFRRDTVTGLVAAVSRGARKIKPRIHVMSAVLTDGAEARDVYGQDWKLWLDQGYLDFACPMTYARHIDPFEETVRRDRRWAGSHKLVPGISECWLAGRDQTVRHVAITRKHGAVGFFLFQGYWIRPRMY